MERGRVGRVTGAPEDAPVTAYTRNTAGVCAARGMARLCSLLACFSVPAVGSLCVCGPFSLWSAHALATRAPFVLRFLAPFSSLFFIFQSPPSRGSSKHQTCSRVQFIFLEVPVLPVTTCFFLLRNKPAAVRPIHEYDLPLSSRMRRRHLWLLLLLVCMNRHACRDLPTPLPGLHLCNLLLPTGCRLPGSCFVLWEASVAWLGNLPRAGCSRPPMLSVVQRYVSGGLALQRRALHKL